MFTLNNLYIMHLTDWLVVKHWETLIYQQSWEKSALDDYMTKTEIYGYFKKSQEEWTSDGWHIYLQTKGSTYSS